jgi:PIN domain nuclease of toxin-antitoxin system
MSSILVDTHVLLWWLTDSPHLGRKAAREISNQNNTIYVSPLSLLELEIKLRSGHLRHVDLAALYKELRRSMIIEVPYDLWAAESAGKLPTLAWKDPFDAAIMAQAYSKQMILMTADENILRVEWNDLRRLDATK